MKTEAQWQKLWDSLKNEKSRPRNDFEMTRKLFHIYTGYENKMDSMWDFYPLALYNRLITGRWNIHHAHLVNEIARKYVENSKNYIFPVSVDDDYDYLFSSEKQTPYKKSEDGIGEDTLYNSDEYLNFIPTDEELRTFAATDKENVLVGLINRDNKTYRIKAYGTDEKWFAMESIVREYQVYDLLSDLSIALADTPIDKNGDLANILKLIEKNTGFSIKVKYTAFGFDHIKAMGKDFKDTFKSWKSNYHFERDLFQPIDGIKNTFKGLFSFVAVPFVFARHFLDIFRGEKEDKWENAYLMFREPVNHFVDGLGLLIRGLSQIAATTPLVLIKLPLRAVLTYMQNKQPLIEEDQTIQRLVNENTVEARSEIHRKFHKGICRGRETKIDKKNELAFFKAAQFPQDPVHIKMKDDVSKNETYVDLFNSRI